MGHFGQHISRVPTDSMFHIMLRHMQ